MPSHSKIPIPNHLRIQLRPRIRPPSPHPVATPIRSPTGPPPEAPIAPPPENDAEKSASNTVCISAPDSPIGTSSIASADYGSALSICSSLPPENAQQDPPQTPEMDNDDGNSTSNRALPKSNQVEKGKNLIDKSKPPTLPKPRRRRSALVPIVSRVRILNDGSMERLPVFNEFVMKNYIRKMPRAKARKPVPLLSITFPRGPPPKLQIGPSSSTSIHPPHPQFPSVPYAYVPSHVPAQATIVRGSVAFHAIPHNLNPRFRQF